MERLMDLATVLSDKPLPVRTENTENTSAERMTDDKPRIEVDVPLGAGPDDEDNAATSAAPEAKTETETKVEEKADETARDDKGRFQKTVPQEALHAERQKRQALEAELAKAREAKPPPSVLEDEDGAFNSRLNQAMQPLQAKLLSLSVKAARNVPGRSDYDEITQGVFVAAIDNDPQLKQAWLN